MHPLTVLRQIFRISFPNKPDTLDPDLFDYDSSSEAKIVVQRILRDPRAPRKTGIIADPMQWSVSQETEHTVHKGYLRVLLGFRREIRFVTEEGRDRGINDFACIFRAQYLIKVMDRFSEELQDRRNQLIKDNADIDMISASPGPHFRSRVLNPILQRQLRGFDDHDVQLLKSEIGRSVIILNEVYLQEDPLDGALAQRCLKNLLYITPVRFSMTYFSLGASEDNYHRISTNTGFLMKFRDRMSDDAWDESILYDSEIEVIKMEKLEVLYAKMIEASVSSHFAS
jgi:hypothetical protein